MHDPEIKQPKNAETSLNTDKNEKLKVPNQSTSKINGHNVSCEQKRKIDNELKNAIKIDEYGPDSRYFYETTHRPTEYCFPDNVIYDDSMFSSDLEDSSSFKSSSLEITPVRCSDEFLTEQKNVRGELATPIYTSSDKICKSRYLTEAIERPTADNNKYSNEINKEGTRGDESQTSYASGTLGCNCRPGDKISGEQNYATPLHFTQHLMSGVHEYFMPIASRCQPCMAASSSDDFLAIYNTAASQSVEVTQEQDIQDRLVIEHELDYESNERGTPPPASALPPVPVRWLEEISMSLTGMLDSCRKIVKDNSTNINEKSNETVQQDTPTPPLPAKILSVPKSWYFGGGPTINDAIINDEGSSSDSDSIGLTSAFKAVCQTTGSETENNMCQMIGLSLNRESSDELTDIGSTISQSMDLKQINNSTIVDIGSSLYQPQKLEKKPTNSKKEDIEVGTGQCHETVDGVFTGQACVHSIELDDEGENYFDRQWDEIIQCVTSESVSEIESEEDECLTEQPNNNYKQLIMSSDEFYRDNYGKCNDASPQNREVCVSEVISDVRTTLTEDFGRSCSVQTKKNDWSGLPECDQLLYRGMPFSNGHFVLQSNDRLMPNTLENQGSIDRETGEIEIGESSPLIHQEDRFEENGSSGLIPAKHKTLSMNCQEIMEKKYRHGVRSDTVLNIHTKDKVAPGNANVPYEGSRLPRTFSTQESHFCYSIDSLTDQSIEDILIVKKIHDSSMKNVKSLDDESVHLSDDVNQSSLGRNECFDADIPDGKTLHNRRITEQLMQQLLADAVQDIPVSDAGNNIEYLRPEGSIGFNREQLTGNNEISGYEDVDESGLLDMATGFNPNWEEIRPPERNISNANVSNHVDECLKRSLCIADDTADSVSYKMLKEEPNNER